MRVLLFDIDGTLVLSGGAGMRAMDDAFAEIYGIRGAAASVKPDGHTDPGIVIDMLAAALGRTPEAGEVERMIDRYLASLEAKLGTTHEVRVLPGVHAALQSARRRGDVLGLATGNVERGARLKLTRAGLWDYFGFGGFAAGDSDRVALTRRGVEAGFASAGRQLPVVVIGDTPRDVAAARGVGARVVAVATGRHSVADLRQTGADAVVETLERLDEALEQLG